MKSISLKLLSFYNTALEESQKKEYSKDYLKILLSVFYEEFYNLNEVQSEKIVNLISDAVYEDYLKKSLQGEEKSALSAILAVAETTIDK